MDVKNFHTQMYKSEVLSRFHVMEKGFGSIRWTKNNNNELLANFSEAQRFTYLKILPKNEKVLSYWKDENKNIEWFGTVGEDEKGKLYRYDLESREITKFSIPAQPGSPFVLSKLNDHQLLVGAGGMIKCRS